MMIADFPKIRRRLLVLSFKIARGDRHVRKGFSSRPILLQPLILVFQLISN